MYVCRKMKLCSFLLTKGFKYERIEPNKFNPKYNVWLFRPSPELNVAIEEYYSLMPTKSC